MTILILAIGSATGESIQIDTGDEEIVDGFSLAAFWAERESRPEMAAPLTEDEAVALDAQTEGDPNYRRDMKRLGLEGAPVDFAAGVVAVENGETWCPSGIDWAAVENEEWGE